MKANKLLSAILAVAMLLGTMCFTVSAENSAVDTWDGTSYSLDWLSDGNPETNAGDKFYLNSAADLAGLAYYVNTYASTNNIFTGDTVYLNVDVDLAGFDWAPIGTGLPREKNRYYGSFDGQGHTISNLKIEDGHYYAGLFGQIPTYTYTQTFSNLTIHNANVVAANEAKSKEAAGALIGRANGSVVDNCNVTGEIYISGDRFVGGLLGHSYAQVSDCSVKASGTVNANTWQAGGLIGSHGATATYTSSINGCTVAGDVDNGGLAVTSYYASAGGAIGSVSVSGVESTPIDNITVSDVAVSAVSDASGSGIANVACGYTATNSVSVSVETTLDGEVVEATDNESVAAVAGVDGKFYASIASAVDAAEEGDVVTLLPGVYEDKIVINKSVVISGDPAYGADLSLQAVTEKPVIKISDITDGGVKYKAPDVTFDNVAFVIADDAVRNGGYYPSALGFFIEDNAKRNTLTLTNCDFVNESNMYAIAVMAHIPNLTVTNCTFSNFASGISTMMDNGTLGTVNVTDNTYANVEELYGAYWGNEATANSVLTVANNAAADGSTTKISVHDFAKDMLGADKTAIANMVIADNDAKVVLTNYENNAYVADVANNSEVVYNYTSKTMLDALAGNVPDGAVYVSYGTSNQQPYVSENGVAKEEAENVSVIFTPNTEAAFADELENAVWDIVLVANQEGILNRLNSADLTFELNAADDTYYEIIETNDEIEINNVNNEADRFEFHYKGKTDVETDTATRIRIATVKFTGYGEFDFAVKAADTNAVHATTYVDNIVDTFNAAGNNLIINNADEDADGDDDFGTIGSEIVAPTSDLIINIAFPNAVENKIAAYQKMTVTVTGEDIKDIVFDLGSDMVMPAVDQDNKSGEVYDAEFVNGGYVITIANVLTQNTAYDIKVEGAGYRTARYTVNTQETASKTVNFWNNVKDADADVEAGKFQAKKNFLAGDIVKDNNINVYDLSAVVSYFGETGLVGTNNAYAKYDLNRDGFIDSKDVAMVLVSWNN